MKSLRHGIEDSLYLDSGVKQESPADVKVTRELRDSGLPPTFAAARGSSSLTDFTHVTVDVVPLSIVCRTRAAPMTHFQPVSWNSLSTLALHFLRSFSTTRCRQRPCQMCSSHLSSRHCSRSQTWIVTTHGHTTDLKLNCGVETTRTHRLPAAVRRTFPGRLQSAYRTHHSTETAVLKVLTDILLAADNGDLSVLALLDLSAAFDTIDHDILLTRLRVSYGIGASEAMYWIGFYRATLCVARS